MKRAATLPMLKDRVILRTLYGAISFSGTIVELLGGEIDGVDTSDLGISCEFGWNERNDEKIRDNTNKCKNLIKNLCRIENIKFKHFYLTNLVDTPGFEPGTPTMSR